MNYSAFFYRAIDIDILNFLFDSGDIASYNLKGSFRLRMQAKQCDLVIRGQKNTLLIKFVESAESFESTLAEAHKFGPMV